jgi:uroporphyrinogen III methyltransferase/synthase
MSGAVSSESPLRGERVVVTRARHQSEELAAALAAAGAAVEFLPLLEVVAPDDPRPLARAAAEVGGYDWLVFTSANAVEAFLTRLPAGLPASVRVAVVGPATARSAVERGVEPWILASQSDAEGLAAELAPHLRGDDKVLVPQADDARPALVDALRSAGVRVDAVEAYAKRLPAGAGARARELFDGREIGWVTFTSPRIVRHFAELFGSAWDERRREVRALSIGRVTTRELRRLGVETVREASRPTPQDMVAAATPHACGEP